MADLRIYELTDTQASYSTGIYCQVDNSGFSNTKKMDISTIYPLINTLDAAGDINPATATLRIDAADSGDEEKITVNDMLTDSDVEATIVALGNTGWLTYANADIIKNSAKVDSNTLVLSVLSVLNIVFFTGKFDTTSQPATDETLFTLPSEIPTCSYDIYFNASDSNASVSDENYELYIPANTRLVKNHIAGSSGSEAVFSVSYPGI